MAAHWLNYPNVFCVLVPHEGRDDVEVISGQMHAAGVPGAFDLMPVTDPRFPEAVGQTLRGMREKGQKFTVQDLAQGKVFLVLPAGREERLVIRYVRVLFMRGMEGGPGLAGQ